ncbi:MAG: HAD family hydrolase [Chloroflexi bacterium]|nr:HAD family hydrolase [Chloroflexota bacterium]
MTILLSFDIDGTLELGDPPGGVTIEMVRRAHELGYLVGSCSDRPLSSQRVIWGQLNIPAVFIVSKHQLGEVRSQIAADAYYHIGDRDTDFQMAKEAGFGFWWVQEAAAEPWLGIACESLHTAPSAP